MKNIKRYFGIIIFLIITFCSGKILANPIDLKQLSISPKHLSDHLSLCFKTAPLKIHYFTLLKPDRFIIDIPKARCTLPLNKIYLKNTHVKTIRSGIFHQQLRLVFDLKQKPSKINMKKGWNSGRYILSFDLSFDPKKTTLKKITQPSSKTIKPLVPIKSQKKETPLREAIIVIDPGHGGKDPGAVGRRGTNEKDVVLSVAKDLYKLLKKYPGIHPEITRSTDSFVPLRSRLRLARRNTADLFISIHADAYRNIFAQGASVFALSQHGATSEAARWLAQKENYSELGGVDLEGKSYLLRSVLIDLSQTATIQESLIFGNVLLTNLHRFTRLHTNKVEQAPFIVLKSPDIPSVLVEIGFISNSQEELRLRSSAYQHRVALSLMNGIVYYLSQNPPQNTTWTNKHFKKHRVKRGENLAMIAKQYGTNVSMLKELNHLNNTSIHTGQVLQIL